MLLGSIAFQLSLFYLVNHPDKDMKRYSWETISSTISIFVAVLIFKGVDGVVDYYVMEESAIWFKVLMDFVHLLAWICILQLALWISAGAHMNHSFASLRDPSPYHLKAKSYAILLAHITGFASINAFSAIQQLSMFASGPFMALLVVPLCFLVMITIVHLTDTVREYFAGLDGVKDAFEILWDDEVEEAENDIIGLTISFLLTQAIRFGISGNLPDQEGADKGVHSHFMIWYLILFALLAVVPVVSLGRWRAAIPEEEKGSIPERVVSSLHTVASMSFAWCTLYAVTWQWSFLGSLMPGLVDGVPGHVCVALSASFLAFVLMFCLDKIHDSEKNSEEKKAAIVSVILSFGIMVGFTWEQSFDAGIETIAEEFSEREKHWLQLLITMILALIVLPAWKMYILPKVVAGHEFGHDSEAHHMQLVHSLEKRASMRHERKVRSLQGSMPAHDCEITAPLLQSTGSFS
eukprot:CAMPEP_0174351134 /NCGR_PEP_ID=MMETSP0811_2-20130205/8376_1 /TAXON_ID=73025 ORGANISM="Eutreptiella gymnastica-like, Strain CCMP1594" /NCGR_SAMPLE_ID=MMETSP0811_2 /ASSEMBLY_ACC=CAM_ASM_000667 /LENGTH=463 /DNA_ID=CAMNT_0015480041 /DNA_START=184 /DNA_END=1578 /DNA_ORIENTATION=+